MDVDPSVPDPDHREDPDVYMTDIDAVQEQSRPSPEDDVFQSKPQVRASIHRGGSKKYQPRREQKTSVDPASALDDSFATEKSDDRVAPGPSRVGGRDISRSATATECHEWRSQGSSEFNRLPVEAPFQVVSHPLRLARPAVSDPIVCDILGGHGRTGKIDGEGLAIAVYSALGKERGDPGRNVFCSPHGRNPILDTILLGTRAAAAASCLNPSAHAHQRTTIISPAPYPNRKREQKESDTDTRSTAFRPFGQPSVPAGSLPRAWEANVNVHRDRAAPATTTDLSDSGTGAGTGTTPPPTSLKSNNSNRRDKGRADPATTSLLSPFSLSSSPPRPLSQRQAFRFDPPPTSPASVSASAPSPAPTVTPSRAAPPGSSSIRRSAPAPLPLPFPSSLRSSAAPAIKPTPLPRLHSSHSPYARPRPIPIPLHLSLSPPAFPFLAVSPYLTSSRASSGSTPRSSGFAPSPSPLGNGSGRRIGSWRTTIHLPAPAPVDQSVYGHGSLLPSSTPQVSLSLKMDQRQPTTPPHPMSSPTTSAFGTPILPSSPPSRLISPTSMSMSKKRRAPEWPSPRTQRPEGSAGGGDDPMSANAQDARGPISAVSRDLSQTLHTPGVLRVPPTPEYSPAFYRSGYAHQPPSASSLLPGLLGDGKQSRSHSGSRAGNRRDSLRDGAASAGTGPIRTSPVPKPHNLKSPTTSVGARILGSPMTTDPLHRHHMPSTSAPLPPSARLEHPQAVPSPSVAGGAGDGSGRVNLMGIPKGWVIEQLNKRAGQYWHDPSTSDIKILVPVPRSRIPGRQAPPASSGSALDSAAPTPADSAQSFHSNQPPHAVWPAAPPDAVLAPVGNGDEAAKGLLVHIRPGHSRSVSAIMVGEAGAAGAGRRGSLPGKDDVVALVFPLHQDYLLTQSSLFRQLLSSSSSSPAHSTPATRSIKGARLLPTPHTSAPAIYLPLPDPASFSVLVHWLYWGDVSALESALNRGLVEWQGLVKNVHHLGLDDGVKRVLGRWWRRWIKTDEGRGRAGATTGSRARGRAPAAAADDEDDDEDDDDARDEIGGGDIDLDDAHSSVDASEEDNNRESSGSLEWDSWPGVQDMEIESSQQQQRPAMLDRRRGADDGGVSNLMRAL